MNHHVKLLRAEFKKVRIAVVSELNNQNRLPLPMVLPSPF